MAARLAHNQEVARSSRAPATNPQVTRCWTWAFGALALTGLAIGLAYWWLHCPSLRAIGCL